MSIFETLSAIVVNDKVEQKNNLNYLSWAYAWGELLKVYPDSFYTVYKSKEGNLYHTDGRTCWVETGVTVVDGDKQKECIEYLPVMNHANRSIPLESVTSMDVNKAIQRSITKAIARHGLALAVYAGEDLEDDVPPPHVASDQKKARKAVERTEAAQKVFEEVDALISEAIKGKSREDIQPVVSLVKQVCGGANYKAVTDEKILTRLLKELKK